ncbi:MAG: hypothetical protein EZS28_041891, partial [Streblomastix strix]
DVDLFACAGDNKLQWIDLPGTLAKDNEGNIGEKYKQVNDSGNITRLVKVSKLFKILGLPKELLNYKEDQEKLPEKPVDVLQTKLPETTEKKVDEFAEKYKIYKKSTMTMEQCIILCTGLKDLSAEIHNDARPIEKEITLMPLFQSINSLKQIEGITDEFIDDVFLRVIRYKDEEDDKFILKMYCEEENRFKIHTLTKSQAQAKLERHTWYEKRKQYNLWRLFQMSTPFFQIDNIIFTRKVLKPKTVIPDEKLLQKRYIELFQGWKFERLEKVDMEVIKDYLYLIKNGIAVGNEVIYDYLLKWIAWIIQNPAQHTMVSIIIRGIQGCGKNTFTNVIAEFLDGYLQSNLVDVKELTGKYSKSAIEGMVLDNEGG